ncbi:MAG: hypothetical protein E7642_04675 [Ruminococcaceae bacterium]|nr:hypothetical protein [Oscillospiraceae bacterium]
MRITELNITEFGCLKNKVIEPSDKLNIIYGENESGKSTVLLFIKFMLYGLTRRSSANSERERSISWSSHRASGSMTFIHGDKHYRIERSFTEATRGGSEKLSILCLDDGLTVNTDKSAGEFFLGVPREAFESSACIGQMRSAEINGEKVASSIENMLSAADESVDTAKILKNLDNIRVSYRHKNKSGGSLYDGEQKINQLRMRAERAREALLSLDGWEQKLEHSRKDRDIAQSDFEHKDALLSELNKVSVLKRFEKLRAMQEEQNELEKQKKSCENSLTFGGYTVDRSHTAELKLCAKELLAAQKNAEAKRNARNSADDGGYDRELALMGEKLESVGGSAAIENELSENKKRAKRQGIFAVVSVILAIALGVDGAALIALMGLYGAICFIGIPIFLTFSIIFFVGKAKTKKRIKQIAAEYQSTPDGLLQKLSLCQAELVKKREYEQSLARLDVELEYAEREMNDRQRALADVMSKTLSEHDSKIETAAAEFKRLELLIAEKETLCSRADALSRMIDAEREALIHYDEQDLREQISVNIDEVTPKAIAEAERQRSFLAEKLRALNDRISGLENTVVGLRATAEDPLPILDELEELEKRQRSDNEFYDALTLAMESIESAANVMRGSVTPVISKQAGELLDKLTAGKYSVLRTTSALGVSLDLDGYSVKSELLSAGTRDIAYLALRLSLFMRIFESELPPLVLDESLAQLDDNRAERVIALLGGLSAEGIQTLLFTSHKREEQISSGLGLEYNAIIL